MKIGLNGQKLSVSDPAGPEFYTKNLYEALAEIDKANEYVIYTDAPESKLITKINQPNFKYKQLENSYSWTQVALSKELTKNPVDVFFTPIHTIPIFRNPKTKYVSMIHGLEYKFNLSDSLLKKLLKGKHEWYVSKFSDVLIVPSEFTKEEILSRGWGISENKIHVVPEGAGREFYKRTDEEISQIKSKYGLSETVYLLFISTIQPRKNLPKLIEGFSCFLKKTGREDVKLFVAGKKGWSYEESLEAPRRYGVENKVLFGGRIPQEDLPALLSGASAFVSTSLEEGFGLPLIEAMASEVPCIVSHIQAFKETGGESVWYVRPESVEDICEKISNLFLNGYSKDLIQEAKFRADEYTWGKSAVKTLEVFKTVANR